MSFWPAPRRRLSFLSLPGGEKFNPDSKRISCFLSASEFFFFLSRDLRGWEREKNSIACRKSFAEPDCCVGNGTSRDKPESARPRSPPPLPAFLATDFTRHCRAGCNARNCGGLLWLSEWPSGELSPFPPGISLVLGVSSRCRLADLFWGSCQKLPDFGGHLQLFRSGGGDGGGGSFPPFAPPALTCCPR